MDNQKLIKIGIKHPKELKKTLDCSMSLAYKIWYDQVGLSKKQAVKLNKETGASLDYLLS
jgi:hypothetical protein